MSLFSILNQLQSQGIVSTKVIERPTFGIGEVFVMSDGSPLTIVTNVVGDLQAKVKRAKFAHFDEPTDVAIKEDGSILCFAKHN